MCRAVTKRGAVRVALMSLSTLGVGMPNYILAILLMLLFGVWLKWFPFINGSPEWVSISMEEDLVSGKVFKITINKKFGYDIPVNKDILPLKLKKAEYDNISYRVFVSPMLLLGIRKRFESKLPKCGFSLTRLFQIV